MHHTPKKVTCIGCISITKVASHLQRMIFRLQKLRFAYKYLIVRLQNCISGYKTASRFAIESKIELSNADEKYRINYHTMNNALVEELRNENNRFLFEVLGNPTVTSIMGVEYDYCWGKILSFFDNKSAEAGIVIEYI